MNNFNEMREDATNLYEEGKRNVCDIESSICEHTNDLVNKIKDKPLTSLLIAGGIGFLLSHLLKK